MIRIRSAASADLETIVEFNALLARETEQKELDRAVLTSGVERALTHPELCHYFVAEISGGTAISGKIVGQTMVTYELTDWRNGVLYWIQSVYVRQAFRGQGVFRALFNHVLETAKADANGRGVRLYVEHTNANALATYQRLGMRPSGHLLYEIDWSGLNGATH